MGNCFNRCFGAVDIKRRYPRTRYTGEQDFSIEFENLISEEPRHNETTRLLTDRERQLLSTKQFGVLVHEQNKVDAEIEAKLAQEEKEIERDEAAYYEAKREAARIARLNKDKENASRNSSKAWDNTEIVLEEDDFENFLASVKARSLATRSQVNIGTSSAEIHSSVPGNHHNGALSPQLTLLSQNAGYSQQKQPGPSTDHSSDLEWESDFVGAE